MQTFSPTDYKKWLYYSANFNDHSQKEEFIRCIETESNTYNCSIRKSWSENDQPVYTIQSDFAKEELCLVGEDGRKEFASYFRKNHLENSTNKRASEAEYKKGDSSDGFLKDHEELFPNAEYKQVNPHRKEKRYYQLSLFISAFVYAILFGTIVYFLLTERIIAYIILLYIGAISLTLFMMSRVAKGLLIGHIKGNAVKVTDEQYPQVFEMVMDQAKKLGIQKVPEIYIYYGHFNAFVTKMSGRNYLVLLSEVVETSLNGNQEVLRFVIGHEMGHIKRKHLSKSLLLLPSKFIPFLPLAYSRACEFTCDRVGYSISPNGAVDGMMTMAIGKELFKKIDPKKFIDNAVEENSFWVWFSEKFSTHPHLVKRLKAIKDYNQFR